MVCGAHGIRLLLQFGSTVTGRTHESSDVDLAVLLDKRPSSLDAHLALVADLQAFLPGHDVDVALVNGADPLFLKKITEQRRLLYGTSGASTRTWRDCRMARHSGTGQI